MLEGATLLTLLTGLPAWGEPRDRLEHLVTRLPRDRSLYKELIFVIIFEDGGTNARLDSTLFSMLHTTGRRSTLPYAKFIMALACTMNVKTKWKWLHSPSAVLTRI